MTRRFAYLALVAIGAGCGGDDAGGADAGAVDAGDISACGDPSRGSPAGLFTDVTASSGVQLSDITFDPIKGAGVAVADVDGDGDLDIVAVTRVNGTRYYRNSGALVFEDATTAAGLDSTYKAGGVALSDLDNDGDPDLLIMSESGNRIYRNTGGVFTDVTGASGLTGMQASQGVLLADFDNDGLLDIFVANYDFESSARRGAQVFRNQGALAFADIASAWGISDIGLTWTAAALDVDQDGDLDLYIANDALVDDFDNAAQEAAELPGDALLRNDTTGTTTMFTNVTDGLGLDMPHSSMGAVVADFDRDGRLDLYVSNSGRNKLYIAQAAGGFVDRAEELGVAATRRVSDTCPTDSLADDCLLISWGAAFQDFDLDGSDELLVINGAIDRPEEQPAVMFRGAAGSALSEVDPELGCISGRALVAADFDDDGDLDLVVTSHEGPVRVYRTQSSGDWLRVSLIGTGSNREGRGAVVTAELEGGGEITRAVGAGGMVHSSAPAEAHFGLGSGSVAALEVRWPDGTTQRVSPVSSNQKLTITQP